MISRRRLLAAGLVLPVGVRTAGARAFEQSGVQPRIGDARSLFDAWFGPGTADGDFTHYPPVAAGRASYDVRFDADDRAQTIVGNFHDLAGGGIPHVYADTHEVGQSQFVPVGAIAGPMGQLGVPLSSLGVFGVRGWSGADVPGMNGRAGHVMVVDRFVRNETIDGMIFKETLVTTESDAIYPIVATDTHPGPHSPREAWDQYPGGVLLHQSGMDLNAPPVPGHWTISGRRPSIQVQPDQPLSLKEAGRLKGSMLPASDEEWSAWIPVTPVTSWQIRLHQFRAHDTGDQFLTAQFVDGDEAAGMVTRIDLVPTESL